MEHREFRRGEQLWLNGREVTFMEYHRFEYHRSVAAPRIGAAVVRRHDEIETRVVPLWKLTRDRAESLARANAIPAQLTGWERPAPTN
jgi:hypothetical protein